LRCSSWGTSTATSTLVAATMYRSWVQAGLAKVSVAPRRRTWGQPNFTVRSPWMASSRPVFCSTTRSSGARSQFQPKTAMNTAASTSVASRVAARPSRKRIKDVRKVEGRAHGGLA
jgi:hypothetical protein